MPQAKHLLIGSTRSGSGKSATILGLTYNLQTKGYKIGYGKPIGTFTSKELPESAERTEADVEFIRKALNLPTALLRPTLLNLDRSALQRRLSGEDKADYKIKLEEYKKLIEGDLVLLEAPANTAEGAIFGLSLEEMAEHLESPILLVMRFGSLLVVDHILTAKRRFGDRLLGVVINDIPDEQYETAIEILHPYLENEGIPVLAMMPENRILRSVSVSELIEQLGATVLCRPENIDLDKVMVEELKIGAMDVNSAQSYFRKSYNKAVITGSSRIDLQFAALETSTNCIILTGRPFVSDDVAHKAMELGVPVLAVNKDTLSTVSVIEGCLGQVRLHEGVKMNSICDMMAKYFNFDRLLKLMKIQAL
ncbi:MAG: phosphotransacetylase family protein [Pseudanabaena sp. ELA748]